MEEAKNLRENINKIMNGRIELQDLIDSFYEYIKSLKKDSEKTTKKKNTWASFFMQPLSRASDHLYKTFTGNS